MTGQIFVEDSPSPGAGPPYPSQPIGTSNAIGAFIIGVSPIGEVPLFDIWDTVISQYANSPALTSLITSWFDALDQTTNFEEFYDNVWNIDTANGYGLDVWARIVGISRVITINNIQYFGFIESTTAVGFGQGPLFNGVPFTANYAMTDQQYRSCILAKARANITNDSIPQINNLLMNLFAGRGQCWVTDGIPEQPYFGFLESNTAQGFNQAPFYNGEVVLYMNIQYIFEFPLTVVDYGILNSGVIPKPLGTVPTIVVI